MIYVPVSRVILVPPTVGFAEAVYGLATRDRLVIATGLVLVAVFPVMVAIELVRQARIERRFAKLPRSVVVERGPDEDGFVAMIHQHDGGVVVLPLPPDYDPRDDDGRWLIRQLVPDARFADEEAEDDD